MYHKGRPYRDLTSSSSPYRQWILFFLICPFAEKSGRIVNLVASSGDDTRTDHHK
jgi:hypothetical protein